MERKRELTSVDLAAMVGELSAITGAKVGKAYRYDEDLFRFRMRHYDFGRLELLVQVGPLKHLHLADPATVPNAPERPPNFARMLRNQLGGAELVGVEQYQFDRIVRLDFERGDEQSSIIAELFGEGNLVVVDATDQIIDTVRSIRLRSRSVVPGETYTFPDPQANPFTIERSKFDARIRESDADLVRTLATQLNLGGTYAEEVCSRAAIDGGAVAANASEADLQRVYEILRGLGQQITAGEFSPRVYYADDRRIDVVPLPLEQYEDHDFESFERFTDAVADYFGNFEADEPEDDTPSADEAIARQQRVVDQQEAAIEQFAEDAAEKREEAEALYAHYDLVDEILSTIRAARSDGRSWEEIESTFASAAGEGNERAAAVRGISGERGTVTIELDDVAPTILVDEAIERNADRLYREAKEIEEKREGAKEALADTRKRIQALEAEETTENTAADNEPNGGGPRDWVAMDSIPVRQSEPWYDQFRWFHTSDDFLVIGGRNADQNEALVRKYLEPSDRFAHASAHGGPATILKATGPSEPARDVEFSEQTLQEMAQFAVSYSSVWKAGQFAGDAYHVSPDQVSKTPESGETLEKGGFVIRGERSYRENVPVGVAIGITCEPETRVIGGPPDPIEERSVVSCRIEPGKYAQSDVAKRIYRQFRESFTDTSFVRKVASPDLIQEFLPPGQSRIID